MEQTLNPMQQLVDLDDLPVRVLASSQAIRYSVPTDELIDGDDRVWACAVLYCETEHGYRHLLKALSPVDPDLPEPCPMLTMHSVVYPLHGEDDALALIAAFDRGELRCTFGSPTRTVGPLFGRYATLAEAQRALARGARDRVETVDQLCVPWPAEATQ